MGYYNWASTQNILKYNLFHICSSSVLRLLLVSVQNHDSSMTTKRNTWVSLSQRIILLYLRKLMAVAVDTAVLLSNPGCMDVADKDGGSEPLTPLVPGFQVGDQPS